MEVDVLLIALFACAPDQPNSADSLLLPDELLALTTDGRSCLGDDYFAFDDEATVRIQATFGRSLGDLGPAPPHSEAAVGLYEEGATATFSIYQGRCLLLPRCAEAPVTDCTQEVDQVWRATVGSLSLTHDDELTWGELTGASLLDYRIDPETGEPTVADEPLGPIDLDVVLEAVPYGYQQR